jgi:hypothetical protein
MNGQAAVSMQKASLAISRAPVGVLQRQCACGQHTQGEGECRNCVEERAILQRHGNGLAGSTGVPPIVHDVLRAPGQPLDAGSRIFMERRFGYDFSSVRVHTDSQAAESARSVNASAYTVGNRIVFGANRYSPDAAGRRLLAHELTHTLQQRSGVYSFFPLAIVDSDRHEREADLAAAGDLSQPMAPVRYSAVHGLFRQKTDAGVPAAPTPKATPAKPSGKCEEFPGGSTDCEVDPKTGTPTGKVTHAIDEKNPCTRPCVESHEAVHVKQLRTFCPELRDCYLASDKGKRPASDCFNMALSSMKKRECEAYKVSAPCVEKRLSSAPECQTKENKPYGARKLASEKCFLDQACAEAGAK